MEITIDKYSKKNEGDFERLWVSWLANSMGLTPQKEDLDEVRNPEVNYIEGGGMAFYANVNGQCVGVVAVKRLNETEYEFCKLVVNERARGQGLGKRLVQRCIDFVKEVKGSALYLQSFHKLDIAVNMYKRMGFVDCVAPRGMLVVERTEIIMKKKI
ncbi:GNAT family N-acetyltransferase [Allomuricauda sp. SCSIO 65647]|uniref:GNAT family N-acetyltransferase n=1 Tax=Allomuricauda sp. SCSIO 65647 TaxID=2908843 RepID=UPI001F3F40E1|nr:GNAT family N-acetyltransferase [Muricauda sp. SCSIO 65647]UJH68814.1 GNAT family N-acetyltransferase [Muricauda sp. SCSIO 65647]